MTWVSETAAVYNCAEDTIGFCLEPETLPVFFAWLDRQGFIKPGYTAEMMQADMRTILAAIKAHSLQRRRG